VSCDNEFSFSTSSQNLSISELSIGWARPSSLTNGSTKIDPAQTVVSSYRNGRTQPSARVPNAPSIDLKAFYRANFICHVIPSHLLWFADLLFNLINAVKDTPLIKNKTKTKEKENTHFFSEFASKNPCHPIPFVCQDINHTSIDAEWQGLSIAHVTFRRQTNGRNKNIKILAQYTEIRSVGFLNSTQFSTIRLPGY
jgi:hypothetical protein